MATLGGRDQQGEHGAANMESQSRWRRQRGRASGGKALVITGKTKLLAHLGVPTEFFKAPMIYNPYFEDREIDAVVVPMGCEAESYPDFLRLLFELKNIAGALISPP